MATISRRENIKEGSENLLIIKIWRNKLVMYQERSIIVYQKPRLNEFSLAILFWIIEQRL